MKLQKIVDALPSLRKLAAADLSLHRLYFVKKLVSVLQPEFDFFDEKRRAIFDKYKDVDGKKVAPEHIKEADKELKELLNFDVKIKYKMVEIHDSENIKLSLNDLEALDGFVKIIFTEEEESEE